MASKKKYEYRPKKVYKGLRRPRVKTNKPKYKHWEMEQ